MRLASLANRPDAPASRSADGADGPPYPLSHAAATWKAKWFHKQVLACHAAGLYVRIIRVIMFFDTEYVVISC